MIDYFSDILGESFSSFTAVNGGDISKAYLAIGRTQSYFIKVHAGSEALLMFETEQSALKHLLSIDGVQVPEAIRSGKGKSFSYLIMQYIPVENPEQTFWENLATVVASLHQQRSRQFGFSYDNYIGPLRQPNHWQDDWPSFYYSQRLEPQARLALDNGKLANDDLKALQKLSRRLEQLCPEEPPSLIHGDLWAGNKLCGAGQKAYLIDPSISYSHREMDLAMAHLFGGFDPYFFRYYQSYLPLADGFESRLDLYQLYYLLVHLNLFGRSYLGSVKKILLKYI